MHWIFFKNEVRPTWRHLIPPLLKTLRFPHCVFDFTPPHQQLEILPMLLPVMMFFLHWWRTLNVEHAWFSAQNPKLVNHFSPQTGYEVCKSDVISQLEQGKELWREGRGFPQDLSPGELHAAVLSTRKILILGEQGLGNVSSVFPWVIYIFRKV